MDGEPEDLPFATELGLAAPHAGGFAVGALAAMEEGTRAVIALVGGDGASGRIVNLGSTHGGAAPPRVAGRADELFVVVPDSDASGGTLRLGVIRDPRETPEVTWGAVVSEGWDESQAFDVIVGEKRALIVWDQWTSSKDRSVVVASSFDPDDISSVSTPEQLSGEGQNAEAPRLVERPGGSWLGYLERTPEPTDAGAPSPTEALDEGTGTVVDLGRRALVVVPLDRHGKPTNPPRRVSPDDGHVLVFDLAPAADGALELVWRDDATSPGVERGVIHLARVRPDGSVKHDVIEEESIGSGAPSLLYDPAPAARRGPTWLTVGGVTDLTQLVALLPDGKPAGRLRSEAAIGRGDVLARSAERLLVGTPLGRSVELTVVSCDPAVVEAR